MKQIAIMAVPHSDQNYHCNVLIMIIWVKTEGKGGGVRKAYKSMHTPSLTKKKKKKNG